MQLDYRREDSQKLWVQTPFPVTHNVLAYWIKAIAPPFSINEALRNSFEQSHGWPDEGSFGRWQDPSQRYLKRRPNPDGSEKFILTDGDHGKFWTILDLPDDKRKGFMVHDWALVYCSHPAHVNYLDSLQNLIDIDKEAATEEKGLSSVLKNISRQEKATLKELASMIHQALSGPDFDSAQKIRAIYGSDINHYGLGEIPKAPEDKDDSIVLQTRFDVFRQLDSFLIPDTLSPLDQSQKELIDYTMFGPISPIRHLLSRQLPE